MSTSQHPVALRLERVVGGDARLLAIVMGLPLVDGIFPALILAGALDGPLGMLQVGLLVFGGSATVAVIVADMDGQPRELARIVLTIGAPLIVIAAIQAALAPAIGSVLDVVIFERFAAIVILAVAAQTASARVGEYLPRPAIIVGLGLVASVDLAGAELTVLADPTLVGYATGAAVVGVAFALVVALAAPALRAHLDIDRFRFGSAVALGLLPLSILGQPFGHAPLAVLALTAIFALDPGQGGASDRSDTGSVDDSSERAGSSQSSGARSERSQQERSGSDEYYPEGPEPWM